MPIEAAGRMSRVGRAWRLTAAALALAALGYGTVAGTDDHFPFGPMVMFAFSVPADGEIRSTYVEAETAAGDVVRVPLSPAGVGLRRAEIEGQLPTIVERPELLQALADAHRRLNPDQPRYRRLFVRVDVTRLRDGVAAGTSTETVATWSVR